MPDNTETLSPAVPVFATANWFIKRRVKSVEIAAVQMILNDAETFPEPLEMDDFPCPEEFNGIIDIRIVFDQPEDIIVGSSGFLFGGEVLCQIGDGIAGRTEKWRKKTEFRWRPAARDRSCDPHNNRRIPVLLICSAVRFIGQLMDDGADHFHMV